MGIEYSHSTEEEVELKKRIHDKKFHIFHENFVDEKGNPTQGETKQIIFGTENLRKKSIGDIFTTETRSFDDLASKVKRLLDLYPIFYDLYEKNKIEQYMNELKIKDVNQIDKILKKTLKGNNISSTPRTNLDKLDIILFLKQNEELSKQTKKIGEFGLVNYPTSTIDKLTIEKIYDGLYLSKEPEFFNEMILVYLVTIFKEYLKSTIEAIFTICPELKNSSKTKIPLEPTPDKYGNILTIFKNNLQFDLESEVSNWKIMEEKFLRRDLLIHSNGIPNEKYNEKTDNASFSSLKTNTNYLSRTLEIFRKVRTLINTFMWRNYVNPKFLEQMSSEDNL